jgi:hypothetical protein
MKNLLNDAVRELVLRVNDEMIAIKEEIKVAENKGDKLNILEVRRERILKLFKRLDYLQEQAGIRELEVLIDIEDFKFKINIQLEDLLDIINEAGIEMIDIF